MSSNSRAVKSAWKRYPWLGLQTAKSGVERGVFSHAENWVREDEIMRLHTRGVMPQRSQSEKPSRDEHTIFPRKTDWPAIGSDCLLSALDL